jgi:membrane protease YdiL (CAAX protease family)
MTTEPSVQAANSADVAFPWRYAIILLAACPIANLLILPYEVEFKRLNTEPSGKIVWVSKEFAFHVERENRVEVYGLLDVGVTVVQSIVLSVLPIYLGLKLGPVVGLGWPPLKGWGSGPASFSRMLRTVLMAVALGAVAVMFTIVLWKLLPADVEAEDRRIVFPHWALTTLASIGAGTIEEVWFRLGLMTTIVWVAAKLARQSVSRQITIWFGIACAGVVFGAMHLPLAASLGTLTPVSVADVILTGLIYGAVFGWLYWRKGLVAAMTAHATQDILTKVILPLTGIV